MEDTAPNSIRTLPFPQRVQTIGPREMEMFGGWSHSQPRAKFPGFSIFGCGGNILPSFQIHMAQGQRHEDLSGVSFSVIKRPQI